LSLRVQIEEDLATTLESADDFGLPIVLISPDGEIQEVNGQILYDTQKLDPETGLDIIVHKPVVTVRRSSLTRIPLGGERWGVRIPEVPDPNAEKTLHMLEQAPEDGKSIGFVRLYLTRAVQAQA
jgi:hypothetical protein